MTAAICHHVVEKYTPHRSGLRERRRAESPKLKEPTVTELWLPEEQLELWQVKSFTEKYVSLAIHYVWFVVVLSKRCLVLHFYACSNKYLLLSRRSQALSETKNDRASVFDIDSCSNISSNPAHLRFLWHAPLGVRSAKRRHQSPDWLCSESGYWISVLLDSLHPYSTRASWWSPPVLQVGSC